MRDRIHSILLFLFVSFVFFSCTDKHPLNKSNNRLIASGNPTPSIQFHKIPVSNQDKALISEASADTRPVEAKGRSGQPQKDLEANRDDGSIPPGALHVIQGLIKVSEEDRGVSASTYIAKNQMSANEKFWSKVVTCRTNAARGSDPGDRVQISYPLNKEKQASFVIEGGDICEPQTKRFIIARHLLGMIYSEGKGLPHDYQKAVHWYRLAAKKGFAHAEYQLGLLYHKGQGVEQSFTEAARYYRMAADQGLTAAQNSIGNMYYNGEGVQKIFPEAAKWYRRAAEGGDALAQNNLGSMYQAGRGVALDYIEAASWYRKAADQDYAPAQNNLGDIYANGYPYGYDFAEAIKWYRKAAKNGLAAAQKNLGVLFQMGRGGTHNYDEAAKWFKLAADQGEFEAMAHLGYLYEHGLGTRQDKAKAQALYIAIAQQADADTLFFLGVGWEHDDRQPNDNGMAYLWYSLSAHKGIEQAQKNRVLVVEKMTAMQIMMAEQNSRALIQEVGYGG